MPIQRRRPVPAVWFCIPSAAASHQFRHREFGHWLGNNSHRHGTYTGKSGIGPELIHVQHWPFTVVWLQLQFRKRSTQPDVVKVHHTCTAGCCYVTRGAETDRDPVNIRQVDALVDEGLQRDDPLHPVV